MTLFCTFVKNALGGNISQRQVEALIAQADFERDIDLISIQSQARIVRFHWAKAIICVAQGKLHCQKYQAGVGNIGLTPLKLLINGVQYTHVSLNNCGFGLDAYYYYNHGRMKNMPLSADWDSESLTTLSHFLGHDCSEFLAELDALDAELKKNIAAFAAQ